MFNVVTTKQDLPLQQLSKAQKVEVIRALQDVGADRYDLMLPESHYLPRLLKVDEQLLGAVYGKYKLVQLALNSRGLLVITDRRMILIDKKPLFLKYDDISFDGVSGITYGQAGLGETVTLNTHFGDISFRTFNAKCANNFVKAVEAMLYSAKKERRS